MEIINKINIMSHFDLAQQLIKNIHVNNYFEGDTTTGNISRYSAVEGDF